MKVFLSANLHCFKKFGQPRRIFVYFRIFLITIKMWILKSIDVVRWIWTLGCSYVLLNSILFCQKMVSFGDTTLWWGSNDSQHTDPLSTLNILNFHTKGQEPWSSGYGRRLMFQRLWVQIPAPYTGWTFFHIYLL